MDKTIERKIAKIVKSELDTKNYEDTAWLKAFREAGGDDKQSRASYVEIRTADLNDEYYEEAKKYVQSLKLKNNKDWLKQRKLKTFPLDIPKAPNQIYGKKYEGSGIFLGTGLFSNQRRKWLSYQVAKKNIKKLKIKSRNEWYKYTKSTEFQKNIPVNPYRNYKKEWKGWPDFLGTGRKPRSRKN